MSGDTTADSGSSAGEHPLVLVIEDEALFAKAVHKCLLKAGYRCLVCATLADAARQLAAAAPDLILLDMRLPDGTGLDFLAELRERRQSDIPVIVLTAFSDVENAVAAMKLDAADYLKKPIDLEELLRKLERVLEHAQLSRRLDYSQERESRAVDHVRVIGEHPSMQEIRRQIERVARLSGLAPDQPPAVLILGETGVGKDLAARALHLHSDRRDAPFVHVDCAALPKELIEAELFGHERGAFTDAHTRRIGLVEAAESGTVFLDEIAEIPLDLQTKLLALLERRRFRRVGSSQEQATKAWFLAGTNRSLERMVEAGEFRNDLYYRLKVLTLDLPPLRERGDDILRLAEHFIDETARRFGLPRPELTAQARRALLDYRWPGNVRELAHLIERAILLCEGTQLTPRDLSLDAATTAPESAATEALSAHPQTLSAAEAELIREALQRSAGNISEAARQLGITRMTLRYRMQKYGIAPRPG